MFSQVNGVLSGPKNVSRTPKKKHKFQPKKKATLPGLDEAYVAVDGKGINSVNFLNKVVSSSSASISGVSSFIWNSPFFSAIGLTWMNSRGSQIIIYV